MLSSTQETLCLRSVISRPLTFLCYFYVATARSCYVTNLFVDLTKSLNICTPIPLQCIHFGMEDKKCLSWRFKEVLVMTYQRSAYHDDDVSTE